MTKRCGRFAAGIALALSFAIPAAAQSNQTPSPASVPVISDTGRLQGPRQPIFFRHDVHVGKDQIPCLYCHYTVAVSSEPGVPALQTCIGCHQIIGGSTDSHRAEIQKVRTAWADRKPPQWIRVYALPGFARFPHMRHIKRLGEQSCGTCHGDVASMSQVYQFSTLRMGWCIRCHAQNNVSRDCSVCHY